MNSTFIYLFGALGGLLFGYDTGIVSGALHYVDSSLHVQENSLAEGMIVASLLIGAAFGAIIAGRISDTIGRKKSLLASSIIFVVGALLSGIAPSVGIIISARIILGFGVGSASALVPIYLSELAPANRRGSLAFLNQMMIVIGILLSYVTNYALTEIGSEDWNVNVGWRIALGVAFLPALVMFFGTLFLPESPRFLVRVGDIEAAKSILSILRPASVVQREVDEIKVAISTKTGTLSQLFSKFSRSAIIIGVSLAFIQQFVGVNTVIYYAPKILATVDLSEAAQRLVTIGIGLTNVVATIIAIAVIDHINRKTLLTLGGVFMAMSLAGLAIVEGTNLVATNYTLASITTSALLMIYIMSFGVTWGGAMWVVLGEIFPMHVRGIGVGVSSVVNWSCNFIVVFLFPVVLGLLNDNLMWIYIGFATVCLLGVVFVRIKVFETRGKTLEEIEAELQLKATKSDQ